jgi:hypothetical protein
MVRAREAVEAAFRLMETPRPEALDRSAGLLGRACEALGGAREGLGSWRGDGELLAIAARIRERAGDAGYLLGYVRRHHERWNQAMGILTGGYGPSGDAAAVVRRSTVSVQG